MSLALVNSTGHSHGAAARSRNGASFALLQALRQRHWHFVALVSVPLMLEYEAVLKRPEHLAHGHRTP